ncbi:YdgA family protein [Pseudomonas sp. BP8]|uniref:YdgA family protein n=1 Tax=Pseudomonas sp. BP8 TaxID=2817864 RepID=UPI001AE6F93B|nr:YdgA family protein [Pseudomonas sp. BP8]MBP2260950.1 uncharacterized protein YdgA (DUF945 family) [Pseudomonas sp. BP8]HDS1736384.1 YdgA family protein [Pseudomonas putida]
MKKSVGILSGLAVAIAVAAIAGAWYTGKQLPAELASSVARANQEMTKATTGTGGSMALELVSLERHFFSSTAHYRLKAKDVWLGEGEALNFDVGIVDQLEHGPFPWSRVKALKLMPVMVASNGSLEKDDYTAAWFNAAGDRSPVTAQVSVGYGGHIDSDIRLAPVKFNEPDGNTLDFSGLQLLLSGDSEGKAVKIHGNAGRLDMKLVGDDHPPASFTFEGLKIGGNLASTGYDMVYVGNLDLLLGQIQATLGPKQEVLLLKGLEQNNLYSAEGKDKLGGRIEYKVSDISYAGRQVGSAQMVVTLKSLDIPALQSLAEWYQTKVPEVQEMQRATAAGEPLPSFNMSEEEKVKVQADLQKLLVAKPKLAIEDLSFKTANGQSRFSLALDFANPASFDLPPDQLGKQLVSQLKGELSLSKPMIGDLATLQALLEGQSDAQAIAQQSSQAGEMVGMMALQSGMATVKGDDVVSSLHYADGMVDFNGKKMTLEEFAMILGAHLAALSPQG